MTQTGKRCLFLGLLGFLLAGCGAEKSSLHSALPGREVVPGWSPMQDVEVYDTEDLYELVDGQADAFFAYAFEQVAVQTYESASGAMVRVEVWQLGTPADAYGLFTIYRAGRPVVVGNGGDADPGRRLDFWQGRYFVRVLAVSPMDDETMQLFAETVSGALPAGGERPSLMARLPQGGLQEGSEVFFHQEISVQDYLWLGGQNVLALGAETDAVLARYDVEGETAMVLLVAYTDDEAASLALRSLQGSGLGSLLVSDVDERLLVAVFGSVPETEAQTLLMHALTED
jgi:hypothetical protein